MFGEKLDVGGREDLFFGGGQALPSFGPSCAPLPLPNPGCATGMIKQCSWLVSGGKFFWAC